MQLAFPSESAALHDVDCLGGLGEQLARIGPPARPRNIEWVRAIISAAPAPLSDTSPSSSTSRSRRSGNDRPDRRRPPWPVRAPLRSDGTAGERAGEGAEGRARAEACAPRSAPPACACSSSRVLVAQRLLLERCDHTCPQQRRIERLEQEVLGAQFDAAHHRFDLAHRGDHDDRQVVACARSHAAPRARRSRPARAS